MELLIGPLVGIIVFATLQYLGRDEPTAHGKGVLAAVGAGLGVAAMAMVWIIQFLVWLF